MDIGHVNTLMICKQSAVNNRADNIRGGNFIDLHRDKSVIDQNNRSNLNIARQPVIIDKGLCFVAEAFLCCQRERIACFYHNTVGIFKITKSNFRSFCVKQRCDWQIQFVS